MELRKQIIISIQNDKDVDDIINFECENNWEYEVVLDGYITGKYLAVLLKDIELHYIHIEPVIGYRYYDFSSTSGLYLSLTFKLKEAK